MPSQKLNVSGAAHSERDRLHSGGSSKQGEDLHRHREHARLHAIKRAKYRCGEVVTDQEYNRLTKLIRRGEAIILGTSHDGDVRHGKLYDVGRLHMLAVYDPHIQVITTFLPDRSWWRGRLLS